MVDVEHSAVHRKLLDYGIDEDVAAELDRIHQSGIYFVTVCTAISISSVIKH